MTQYRETLHCGVCETLAIVTATRKSEDAVRAATKFSVFCPVCDAPLALETFCDIDTSTVAILGFEYKSGRARADSNT